MNSLKHTLALRLRATSAILFLLGLTTLVGCQGDTSSVGGKVTYKGEAVKGGSLTFVPQGGGRPAGGDIRPDGGYTLGDRPMPGRYKIGYTSPVTELPPGTELKQGQSPPPSPWHRLVPKQNDVEVTSGSNTIDIELIPPAK